MKQFRNLISVGLLALLLVSQLYRSHGHDPSALAQLSILKCPLLFLFEIACPTCGMTRSVLAAAGGQWEASINHHPLGIAVLGIICLLTAVLWISPKQITSLHELLRRHSSVVQPATALGVVFYAFWGWVLR